MITQSTIDPYYGNLKSLNKNPVNLTLQSPPICTHPASQGKQGAHSFGVLVSAGEFRITGVSLGAQFRDGGGSVSGREVVSFGAWGGQFRVGCCQVTATVPLEYYYVYCYWYCKYF